MSEQEPALMTMTQVVGQNVREFRLFRHLSQEQLTVGLAEQGIALSRPTIAQLESGKRPLSIDELLALGLTLGVAPHLFLYPPRGVRVGVNEEHSLQGWLVGGWLWDPDGKGGLLNHKPAISEKRMFFNSLDAVEQLSDEEVDRLAERKLADTATPRTTTPRKTSKRTSKRTKKGRKS